VSPSPCLLPRLAPPHCVPHRLAHQVSHVSRAAARTVSLRLQNIPGWAHKRVGGPHTHTPAQQRASRGGRHPRGAPAAARTCDTSRPASPSASSPAQGSSTTVSRSDIRLIQYLESSAQHGLVRRWRLTGYFPIHLLPASPGRAPRGRSREPAPPRAPPACTSPPVREWSCLANSLLMVSRNTREVRVRGRTEDIKQHPFQSLLNFRIPYKTY
jgi:hypothetical protein